MAAVDGGGRDYSGFDVTGVSEGTATITFTCSYKVTYDGETKSVSGSFDVVVTAADKYTVTVNNGTGGGEYEAGATVTITADAPASGKQFDKWEVNSGSVNLADATSSTTTFTMPAGAVEVTAAYKDSVSDADKLAAAKTVVENALAKINPTNDTEKSEVQAAIDDALREANVTGMVVVITTWDPRKATASQEGKIEVRIKVRLETSDPFSPTDYQMVEMELVIPKLDTQPTPAEKYTVTVNNGTGGGGYEAGATVTITANAPASGEQFDKWVVNGGSVTLADATSSTTTFTMPAGAVSVTATYKTNTGGGSSGDNGSGSDSGNNNSGSSGGDHSGSNHNSNDNGGSNNNSSNNNSSSGSDGSSNHHDGNEDNGTDISVGTPEIHIITPSEELEDAVLTEAEQQQMAGGADIRIELDVKVVTAEAGAADRALVEEALQGPAAGFTIGQYLDISLYKIIGNSRTAITETDGKITVRIDVPDSLKNTDSSNTRAFAVIRLHDGRAEFLEDLDNDADTITIATDRFSTYAVVYQDTAADTGNSGKDDEPKTGDSTPLELYATLSMIAGFSYLLLYFTDRKRGMTEETKKELVTGIVKWAKRGGKIRKCLALAAIFVLLVYYHSIGKKTCVEWEKIYGE